MNFTSDARNTLAPAAHNISNTVKQLGDSFYNISSGEYHTLPTPFIWSGVVSELSTEEGDLGGHLRTQGK